MSRPSTRNRCALCGAPADPRHSPFCGQGCRDRDLLNWLGEGYRLPGTAAPADARDFAHGGLDSPSTLD